MINVRHLTVLAIILIAWLGWFPSAASALPIAGPELTSEPAIAPMQSLHAVMMREIPGGRSIATYQRPSFMPLMVGTDPADWFARKAAARRSVAAPLDRLAFSPFAYSPLPGVTQQGNFDGMADSITICPYYGGCQPPDMALAASSSWVLQGVNTSYAVFDQSGALQPGWPKTMQGFFNVPAPGSCDPSGPFMTDPRAVYDSTDGRFWVSALQIEGAFGINSCPERSLLWVGVSQTSDPTGAWHIYSFNMRGFNTNAAEFDQIGLDGQAFYFGANVFDLTGQFFRYAELFAANKSLMESGAAVKPLGVKNVKFGTTVVDTVQPVLVEGASPAVGLFVSSFNINSGGGNCLLGCSGINVFAMSNPLTSPKLTYKQATSLNYSLAPLADQPGCEVCIETFDTRISGTPVYSGGLISFALETAVNNGTAIVPGILWGQVLPKVNGNTLVRATMYQDGLLSFGGDQAASFGALMPDSSDDLMMIFDTMASTVNPGIELAWRLSTDSLGTLETPVFLRHGPTGTADNEWGEYSATSFEGAATGRIWYAGEYSALGADWATRIGVLHF